MDPVTIGILGGMSTVMMIVVVYLDCSFRADMNAGFARLDERMDELAVALFDLVKAVDDLRCAFGTYADRCSPGETQLALVCEPATMTREVPG